MEKKFLFLLFVVFSACTTSAWLLYSNKVFVQERGTSRLVSEPHINTVAERHTPSGPPAPGEGDFAMLSGEHQPAIEGLALIALFETHDVEMASAVILAENYGAYRYFVGGVVAGRYHIEGIYRDHVVLRDKEAAFRLYLVPLASTASSQMEPLDGVQVGGSSVLDATRAERERMRILSTYDLYPVSDGAPDGYIIGERFPPAVLQATGGQPGDIIVSVNGYAVGHPESDELALASFRNSMKASVLLRRGDGSTYYFNYPEEGGGEP